MSASQRLARQSTAVLVSLLIAIAALPAAAGARVPGEGPGPRAGAYTQPFSPAPTVTRTVVKEEAVRVLPIALAGAALLIAIAGTGYVLVSVGPLRHQLRSQH
jgi:hypothetical protein